MRAEPPASLEGWEPPADEPIARIIDLAFHYRGNVTIVRTEGHEVTGYVFNRNTDVANPFLQYLDEAGEGPFTVPYEQVRTIRFTGKDPAVGNSYGGYQRDKAGERAARAPET